VVYYPVVAILFVTTFVIDIKAAAQGATPTTVTLTLSSTSFTRTNRPLASVHVGCNFACGRVEFRIDGDEWGTFSLGSNGNLSTDNLRVVAIGSHTMTAEYLGNSAYVSAFSSPVSFTVNAPSTSTSMKFTIVTRNLPNITNISPTIGIWGTSVTITGTNFGSDIGAVTVNGVTKTPHSWSDTSIEMAVPINATTGPVVVMANGMVSNSVMFKVLATLSGMRSYSGAVGAQIGILGNTLGNAGAVSFNGAVVTSAIWSPTEIVVTVPPGATSGTVSVAIDGVTYTVTNNFTVLPSPTITSISPTSATAGDFVTIRGVNFGNQDPYGPPGRVSFNGALSAATVYLGGGRYQWSGAWYDTQIDVQIPQDATSGPLQVLGLNGTPSNAVPFKVIMAPTVKGLSQYGSGANSEARLESRR
jgi:hypothetical protein